MKNYRICRLEGVVQRIGLLFLLILSPLIFLLGYVKDIVYGTLASNVTQLKRVIYSASRDVQADNRQKVWKPSIDD